MSDDEEGESDGFIQARQDTPCKVLHNVSILVLAWTIVCMQVEVDFSQTVCGKEMVDHADDTIGPLSCIHSFVNEVVDL